MEKLEVTFDEKQHKGLLNLLTRRKRFSYFPNSDGTFLLVKKVRTVKTWYSEEAKFRRLLLKYNLTRTQGDVKALNEELDREKFDREVVQPFIETRLKFCGEVGELPEYVSTAERKRQALSSNPFIVNHTPFTLP